ncbi:GGDEF domain-containing protein [Roseibium sp.]|uniref:GGDEF domain-containing protein n=1 Tax=Roseibium sp. TaxID=1936156 RepID=UPI003B5207D5
MPFVCNQVVAEINRHALSCDPKIFHVLHLYLTAPTTQVAKEVERLKASEEGLTDKTLHFVYENLLQTQVSPEKQFESMQRSRGHLDAIRSSAESSVEICAKSEHTKKQEKLVRTLTENLTEILNRTNALEQEIAASQNEVFTDSLTGISNRRYLEAEFSARSARHHGPYYLALLDIDHFKRINDSQGHIVGDQVLKLVAAAIQHLIKGDDILCRYGGEEFAILFRSADKNACISVVDTVLVSVGKQKLINRRQGNTIGSVTLSAGLALVDPEDDFETALDRVDRLMYKAKQKGRNQLVVQS